MNIEQLEKENAELRAKLNQLNKRDQVLREAERECQSALADVARIESEINELKDEKKKAQSEYEGLNGRLQALVADRDSGQTHLEFDDEPDEPPKPDFGGNMLLKSVIEEVDGETFSLSENVLEKLEDAGITTVRQMEECIGKNAIWYTTVKGIGQNIADKIESMIVAFRSHEHG